MRLIKTFIKLKHIKIKNMKKDLTEIAIILDESGSMSSCKSDMIGGFNEFIETQKKVKGDINVTFVKFSDYYKMINDATPINHVAKLTNENYTPSNSTALLDAVGKTINSIGDRLSKTNESERPEKVMIVIMTDGEENSSKEFTSKMITDMVTHQREKYKWEFIFIGADIAAWGQEIGVTSNVSISKHDMTRSMKGLSLYAANYRVGNTMNVSDFNLTDAELDFNLNNTYDKNN